MARELLRKLGGDVSGDSGVLFTDVAILGESRTAHFEMKLELGGITIKVTTGAGGVGSTQLLYVLPSDALGWRIVGRSSWGGGRGRSAGGRGRSTRGCGRRAGSLGGWEGWSEVAVQEFMALLFGGENLTKRQEVGAEKGRIVGDVSRHETWVLVLIDVGNGEERHELLDVNSSEAVADFADILHVGDGGVRALVGQFGEVGDGGEKEFRVGGLKMLEQGVKHGDAIRDEELVRQEHVDVFPRDDIWIEEHLVDVVTH